MATNNPPQVLSPSLPKAPDDIHLGLTRGDQYRGISQEMSEDQKDFKFPLRANSDNEERRAEEQSLWDAWANGIISRGLSIGTKLVEGGAILLSAPYAIATGSLNNLYDNAVVNAIASSDDWLRETFPVYGTKKRYEGQSFLSQLGTVKFWAEDAMDGVAFAISAYIGGSGAIAGLKGLAKGTKLTKVLKGTKAFKGLANMSSEAAVKNGIEVVASTAYNTITEAGFEANDVKKQLQEEYAINKYNQPFDELSNIQQNEISNEVAVYAKNVFVGNTLILAIPNLWQSNIFFGKNVGSGANKLFKSLQKGAISPKDLVKNKKVWKGVVKGATEGIVAEGIWEENIQTAMSNYEVRRMNRDLFNEKDTGDDRISGYANEWVKNFTTDEGLKSMFLGALIGAPMGAVSGGRKNAEANKDVTKAKLRYDSFINRLKNVDTRFEENVKSFYKVYEKDEEVDEVDEDGKPTGTKKNQRTKSYINPETGKPEVDLEKVLQLFYQTLNDKSLLDEAVTATMNNDPLHLEVVKQEAVARRVYSVLTDPDFDTIEEAVEYLKKQPDVDLSAFPGLDTEFKEQSEEVKKEIDYYAKILKEAQESLADIKDFQEDKEWGGFKRKLTKAHLLNMSALKALERKTNVVIEEVYAAREAIVAEHPDDYYKRKDYKDLDALRNLYYDLDMSKTFITNKAERERLFKEYKQEQNLLEELREKHETLKKKEDVNDDELLESEYSIEEAELLSGEFQRSNEKDEVLAQREKSNRILAVSEDERDRLAEFGMYNQFKYDAGKHIQTQQEFNKKWEEQEIPSDEDIEAAYELSTTAVDKNTLPEGEINPVELLSDEQKNTLSKYFPETNITDVSPEQAEELYNRLKAIKDEYDIDKIGLDNSKNENKIIDKVLRGDRTGDSNLLNFLKRKIANKVFDKVREILNAFENNPEYAESEYIAKVIKQLLRLRKIFSTEIRKELLESAEFEGFIEDIDSAIAMLTEKLKLAIENQNNKSAKQIESSKNESEYRFEALGINVEESTSEKIVDNKVFPGLLNFLMKIPTIKKIIIEAFSDTEHPKHKIYYERIVEIIKKDKVLSQKIKDFLEAHKHSLIEQAGEAYGDFISHAKLKEQYKQLAKYAASNPINTLVALIRFNTSERKDDAPQDNAIDNFIRSRDLNKLRKDLKEGKPTGYYVTTEQLSALVEVFYQLQMANDLQNDINSEYDHNEEYKNEDEILLEEIARIAKLNKENPGGRIFEIVPTFQQMFAIRDIIRWYKRKFNSGKYFTGWIYQKGIAGSGKTAIVYKWAIKILKLKENQIFSVAHTKEATDNINSVHSSSNSSGVLSKNLEASHISDDVKLLVIDEVGALDNQELAKIAIIVHEINKKRTDDNKLKVLALGDPNQINRSNFGIPVIDDWINIVTNTTTQENNNVLRELKNIESAFPLTVPYRSRVGILNTLADTFMDNFSKVSNLVLKANRAIGNRTVTGAHKGSVNEMVKQINAAKDNGRSKVIIVADINNVPKELKDTGLPIKDFVQVQGSTIDEAYIYIPRSAFAEMAEKNFNDAMYTAISRATEYVFLADTVGNMTWYEDSSVNESSAQFEKDMTDNFDNYTENLSYELGENPKNPPKDKPEDEPNNPPEDEPKDKPDNPPEEEPEDKSKNPPEDEPEETQSAEQQKADIERRIQEDVKNIVKNRQEIEYETTIYDQTADGNKRKVRGKSPIIDLAGRKVVVLNVNGMNVPFYLSTGHGGKADVTSGKWYPIFGIAQDGWMNKLSGNEINNYYDSKILKLLSEELDTQIGDIRNDNSIPKAGISGSHIDFINRDLTPTENGLSTTRDVINKNIENVKNKINAKYDAELESLNNQTASEQKQQQIADTEKELFSETDNKGRTHTYYSTTKEKDGLITTKFLFNRSDKDPSQRANVVVGIPVEKALDDKYTIDEEYVPEGTKVVGVSEIRIGKTGAAATVTLETEEGERYRAEVGLNSNTIYDAELAELNNQSTPEQQTQAEETQEINPEKSINAEPTEEELDDYVVSDTFDDTGEDEDNAGEIHPTPTIISDHQITPKYPSYDAVKRKDKKDTEPRVQIGDTVYGVVVKDSRTGINRVLIIGAIGKNRYRILAELDEAEILDLVSKGELNYTAYADANPIKGAQFVRNSIVNIGTNFTSDTGENTPLLFKGKLGEGSMPLTYHYGSELSQGENVLTKALSKLVRLFKNNLFNAVDYAVIIPVSAKALQKIFPSTTNNANNSLSLKEHVGEREITDELIEDLIANGQIVTDANGKVVYNNETYDTLEKLKQDIHKKEFEGNLYKGTPYIIMRAISNKGKEVFQYIRLNPAKVSKDSKYYFFRGEGANRKLHSKSLMQPIQEFRDALKEITNFFVADGGSFLGDMSFNRTLQEFKHFFSIDPNTKEIIKNKAFTYEMYKANIEKGNKSQYKHLLPTYDILSEELFNKIANSTAIDKVIKGYYGVSQRDKAHTHEEFVELYGNLEPSGSDNNVFIDTFEGKKYAFAPQKNNPSVGAIIEYEYSNGKETSKGEIEKEDFLKGGLGPAQSSLDLIAKANKSIKGKQLRVTKKLGDGRITTKAPNLLDDIMISNSYNAILNKMIKESEVEAKQDWFKTYLEKEQWMIENRIATIEQLQEIKERDNIKWTKIDDEMLDAIVEYDSEGNNNSLRLPLDANVINTLGKDMHTNKKALSDMLGTNLEGISPTKIVIDLDNNEREENLQKKEVPKKDSKEIKESIKDVPKESLEQDVNSFISKELTAEQQKALKKIDKNNNINFKC